MILPEQTIYVNEDKDGILWFTCRGSGPGIPLSDIDFSTLVEEYDKAYERWEKVQSVLRKLRRGVKVSVCQEYGA